MEQIDITIETFGEFPHPILEPVVLTAGYFDGIHQGHQQLLSATKKQAAKKAIKTAVLTFEFPQELKVEKQKKHRNRIMMLNDKQQLLEKQKFDYFIVIHLTEDFMTMGPVEFIESLLKIINIDTFVVGFDYRFGFQGKGDTTLLHEMGEIHHFSTIFIDAVTVQSGEKVSSSTIREAIENGKVDTANKLLNTPYAIKGVVMHGEQKGRLLGFPTANITDTGEYIVPKVGIYIVTIFVKGKEYEGVCNIGYAPTIKNEKNVVVETNIFDFDEDIYGEEITVKFRKKIRDELKFDGIDALKEQITLDVEKAKRYFENCK